jgi:4-carboxymuconolactone decarboxylase
MANKPTPPPPSALSAVTPKLADLTEKVLFGDVWERPQLSKRDRSLITCAVLTALYRPEQLAGHLARALNNGVTQEELSEMITHVAFYGGWPAAVSAATVADKVFNQ